MSNSNESVYRAIDTLVDAKLARLKFDKTISAEVYKLQNADLGQYQVKYQGNIFSAFAADPEVEYKAGDMVYVNVPEGDFAKRKTITTKITNQSLSYNQLVALQREINEIVPLNAIGYNYNNGECGICAGASSGEAYYQYQLYPNGTPNDYSSTFKQYSNKYELIKISASFLTSFLETHAAGNYGVKVVFETNAGSDVEYVLDISSFNGDPLVLRTYSPQSAIVKSPLGYLTSLKSVVFFQEGFTKDKDIQGNEITTPNLFIRDLSISFVEQKDLSDTTYYPSIVALQGNIFKDKGSKLSFVPRLVYQGESIFESRSCTYDWYERDLTIRVGAEGYDKHAGFGWRKVEYSDLIKSSEQFGELVVDEGYVRNKTDFKVVINYQGTTIVSAKIEVKNLNSELEVTIEQQTANNTIWLLLTEKSKNDKVYGQWYFSYPNGYYSSFTESENGKDRVEIQSKLLYDSVTFYCAAYDSSDNYLGTYTYTVTNSSSDQDLTVYFAGEDPHRYDVNGDITIDDSEISRTISPTLVWKDGLGTAAKIQWLGPKDEHGNRVLLEREKLPIAKFPHSLIENLWVDSGDNLCYTISKRYRNNYTDNTVTLIVTTIDQREYRFDREIIFVKDGDQGTSGTTYVIAIRPCNATSAHERVSEYRPLHYKGNGVWDDAQWYKCYVYKEGIEVTSGCTFNWTGQNTNTKDLGKEQVVKATGKGNNPQLPIYLKCEVVVDGLHIYATYGVDVVVGGLQDSLIDMDEMPSSIKYTKSGVAPQYRDMEVHPTYNGQALTLVGNEYVEVDDGQLKPKKSLNLNPSENNIGVITCRLNSNQYIVHPIVLYLDTVGNEAINAWDGQSIELGDNANGAILAPQVGAGKKESDNTFSGVLMGTKVNGTDSGTGLYGYSHGINTFRLLDTGNAYFGPNDEIQISGTSGTIRSKTFIDGTGGMEINLQSGNITTNAFVFNGTNSTFDFYIGENTTNGRFTVRQGTRGNPGSKLMYVSSGSFYLASPNGDMSINLSTGVIKSKDFSLDTTYLKLKSGPSFTPEFTFNIGTTGKFLITGSGQNLIEVTNNGNYKIQSLQQQRLVRYDDIDENGNGTPVYGLIRPIKIDLRNGTMEVDRIDINSQDPHMGNTRRNYGYVGMIEGSTGAATTYNIGIKTENTADIRGIKPSIILQSGNNIGIKAEYGIWINANAIHFDGIPNQYGIKARFAD